MVGALAALWSTANAAATIASVSPTTANAAATITSVSPTTLAIEGGTKVVVKGTGFAAGTTAVCRVDPAPGGTTHLINATTRLVNATLVDDTLVCVAPGVAAPAPGLLKVSLDGGATWVNGSARIRYLEQIEVALDRRPYVGESHGALLLRSSFFESFDDRLHVSASLPAVGASWEWKGVEANVDLVLNMSFEALPNDEIHNDLLVTISWAPGGEQRSVTKRRRFHRVPPPSGTGSVVQVDHARAGLLVDGEVWIGQGWYLAAPSSTSWNNSLDELASIIKYDLAPVGINQGMPYGLSVLPAEDQLAFLDAVHEAHFKVIYPVGQGNVSINHGGPFDNATRLEAIRANVSLVKDHPALLGYYVCDGERPAPATPVQPPFLDPCRS